MTSLACETGESALSSLPDRNDRTQTLSYFILAVLGFSFWFFLALPFASHRETYSWLAAHHTENLLHQLSFGLSSTYRPLAQIVTWFGYSLLDPSIFPTSVPRQALLQGLVYGIFVLAWWLIYSAAPQGRVFAVVACIVGGAFFSGYVHLFHIYGLFYVPVILTIGALLSFRAKHTFEKRELWFAIVATVLVFWHPFAMGLFLGFYFGFYVETFWKRSRALQIQGLVILLIGTAAIGASVALFPREHNSIETRLFGFLVSYRTNEVNRVASLVAFLLALTVIFSMDLSPKLKLAAVFVVSALGAALLLTGLPLLFLWFGAVLIKLLRLRYWSLLFLMLAAALFPFGGGIGTPIYALFAIIVAAYVTALGWSSAEKALSLIKTQYVVGTIIAAAMVLVMIRAGIDVPIVTRVARPLLAERERTYQLESILAWLHNSDYCRDEIAFSENAGSPVDSVESAITRTNRPPAALGDVQAFWKTVLQCHRTGSFDEPGTAVVTFGEPASANYSRVFVVSGKYAGDASLWVSDPRK